MPERINGSGVKAFDLLDRYRRRLREELEACLPPLPLFALARYHLGWSNETGATSEAEGKMLRPLLCLAACQGVGADPAKAIPAAAAVELVHNFSLVHDDIQDAAPLRRHRPTVWKLWGTAQAINVGDALFAVARICLLRLREQGLPPATVLNATRILDEACVRLCHGQYLDLAFETRPRVSQEEYLEMAEGKTAALFQACFHLGAMVAGAGEGTIAHLRLMGKNLGLAFQIQDDVLGMWGEQGVTGKTAADILRKKKTFPLIDALEQATGPAAQQLAQLLAQDRLTEAEAGQVRQLLDNIGARTRSLAQAQQYYDASLRELAAAALNPPATEPLIDVVNWLRERQT